MPVPLNVGDVIRIYDGTTDPQKMKRFLCVLVAEGWFLRINTNAFWKPHFPLPHTGNEHCLDHDSFLELRGVIEYDDYSIESALDEPGNHLGQLSRDVIAQLVEHLPNVRTIAKVERDRIIESLSALL
ncbi:hypothetical protein ACQKQD_18395 [Methylobacterium sp. NPDC080182]|uniref:hypothetical protein n=1 Tax=Methylobacterium sp. NPDC080182 TaxID=3390590 RepID=UPI003D004FB5